MNTSTNFSCTDLNGSAHDFEIEVVNVPTSILPRDGIVHCSCGQEHTIFHNKHANAHGVLIGHASFLEFSSREVKEIVSDTII